jgi:hypothetical protein
MYVQKIRTTNRSGSSPAVTDVRNKHLQQVRVG